MNFSAPDRPSPSLVSQAGFTLVELAVVLLIVGLLLGGLSIPVATQLKLRQYKVAGEQLELSRQALYGFALSKGYLPCPASIASQGVEDRDASSGGCRSNQGLLPWATLGVDRADPWGHLLRYRVLPAFSQSATPFSLATSATPNLSLLTRDSSGNTVTLTASNTLVAVILSQGANGNFAYTESGIALPNGNASNGDEEANHLAISAAGASAFFQRSWTENNGSNGEFDDLISGIPLTILIHHMVAARRLSAA